MVNIVTDAPRFDATAAARIARQLYGIDAVALPLPSERDQNFLLTDPAGERRILKIANAGEHREILEAQQAAMAHVAPRLASCPRPFPVRTVSWSRRFVAMTGEPTSRGPSRTCPARLGTVRHRPTALLEDFGRDRVARMRVRGLR
jgi:hypothetical protein